MQKDCERRITTTIKSNRSLAIIIIFGKRCAWKIAEARDRAGWLSEKRNNKKGKKTKQKQHSASTATTTIIITTAQNYIVASNLFIYFYFLLVVAIYRLFSSAFSSSSSSSSFSSSFFPCSFVFSFAAWLILHFFFDIAQLGWMLIYVSLLSLRLSLYCFLA